MAQASPPGSPREITIGQASPFIGEITLCLPVPWFSGDFKHPAKAELVARALILVQDRFTQGGLAIMSSVIPEGVAVKVLPHECLAGNTTPSFPDMSGLCLELEQIPLSGSCLCPCGCGADLAIRECTRARLKVSGGVVCLSPPAFAVRDVVHPEHKGHGVQGWAHEQRILPEGDLADLDYHGSVGMMYTVPPGSVKKSRDNAFLGMLEKHHDRRTFILCGCGETLGVEFTYAVQEGMAGQKGGAKGDEVAKGVELYYQRQAKKKQDEQDKADRQHREALAQILWNHTRTYPAKPEQLEELVQVIATAERGLGRRLDKSQALAVYRDRLNQSASTPLPTREDLIGARVREIGGLEERQYRALEKAINADMFGHKALDVHTKKGR